MVGSLRINHMYTRLFSDLGDNWIEYRKEASRRSSKSSKSSNSKQSKEMVMLEGMLHIFALSSHYYKESCKKRSEF